MIYQTSPSLTLDELLRANDRIYRLTCPELLAALEAERGEIGNIEELEQEHAREIERIDEQRYFASELLDEIEGILDESTRATEIKQATRCAIENSQFER